MILALLHEAVQAGARLEKSCELMGLSTRTVERWRLAQGGGQDGRSCGDRVPANKLHEQERAKVLEVANMPAFRDLSPKQIVPQLADAGQYIASESTFYRVLREEGQLKHRAPTQRPQPRPRELVADGPEQVWSWDITYLATTVKGRFLYLYLFMDVWSRKIVGWEVHEAESMEHASKLVGRLFEDFKPRHKALTLHSDNGGPMRGSTMKATLERLGIASSFSRPGVSDDNPFSEALFRNLKYRPGYPGIFDSVQEARGWVCDFVQWYNFVHLHSSIGYVTPAARHSGHDLGQLAQRQRVYKQAQQRHPERFGDRVRSWDSTRVVVLNPQGKGSKDTKDEMTQASKLVTVNTLTVSSDVADDRDHDRVIHSLHEDENIGVSCMPTPCAVDAMAS